MVTWSAWRHLKTLMNVNVCVRVSEKSPKINFDSLSSIIKPSSCKEHFLSVILMSCWDMIHVSSFNCFKLSLKKGHSLLFLLTERRGKRKESPLHRVYRWSKRHYLLGHELCHKMADYLTLLVGRKNSLIRELLLISASELHYRQRVN